MLGFAYDGSINGDWVSHYAVQLATAQQERKLNLVHVRDGRATETELAEKLERLQGECERHGVRLVVQLSPRARRVPDAIRSAVPPGPEHYLVCGTRARERHRAFLSGTTSEQLLRSGHCNVLAVRVVQPGLLGSPRRLLLPVAERPGDFRSALLFLRLFAPQVSHLHIVSIARVGRWRFRRMSHEATERSRSPCDAFCERVEQEIRERLGLGSKVMDAQRVGDRGQRVIAVASRRLERLPDPKTAEESLERGLTLCGFLALDDPVRKEVPTAVARCLTAGIRVLLITGDHPDTAEAAARACGILAAEEPFEKRILHGYDLERMRERELVERLREGVSVFARTQGDCPRPAVE